MPSASVNIKVVILWEHEIIEAVKALDVLRKEKKPSPKQITNALRVAFVALYDPEILSGNPFVIMSANRHFFGQNDGEEMEVEK